MKKGILFLLLASTLNAKAQSLKDLLYKGKLKNDSNTVIRKTDDLSTKIDTGTKKPATPVIVKITPATADSSVRKINANVDTSAAVSAVRDSVTTDAAVITESTIPVNIPAVKTNTRIWKEYSDSLVSSLKSEVLPSKKIKKDTYYLMLDYEIGTDGQVNVTNVTSTPENAYLQAEVKQRVDVTPPRLNPVLDSSNQPRKVKRKQGISITKD